MSQQSAHLFDAAQKVIPGGVNSPVRAFGSVGGRPVFISKAQGAYLFDVDGKRYIDYVGSWGPMILGHNHPAVVSAVQDALARGMSFGAPTALEVKLAEKVCEIYPAIDKIRMVNSGTEATMTAIRLARGYTKRDKIIKFDGCYHGHGDALLVKAGSELLHGADPSSAGVPKSFAQHTLVADFNDLEQVEALFAKYPEQIACVIIEPVAGNMNCVLPTDGFLQGLRDLCDRYNSVLIFDEVMPGFRVALGGAEQHYNVKPDLITLGKIIGGGMPVGAVGGRHDIMDCLAPLGNVFHAGTLSGNPIAMAAGLATLNELTKPGFYETLSERCEQLVNGIIAAARAANIPLQSNRLGGMFGLFFTEQYPITSLAQVKACDTKRFTRVFRRLLDLGIYLAPSAFEASFISSVHSDEDINATIAAFSQVFVELNEGAELPA